jgi:putative sigma-54 modulation protein
MKLRFTARATTLTPEMREYCEKRLDGLLKLSEKITGVDVILSGEKSRRKAEIALKAKGGTVVVSEETADLMDSIKLAMDSLEKRLKKEKEKWQERKLRGGRDHKEIPVEEPSEQETRVIRSQACSHKPMSVEEAMLQLRGKNREAFMFRRDDVEGWAVIYKRKDGHFGLILPE